MKKTLYESFYLGAKPGKPGLRPESQSFTATSGSETPEAQCSHTTKNALKVLEILKNFFQEVFKQGLGQSPKVLEGGTNEHIR